MGLSDDSARTGDWLTEAVERARERLAQLPEWARPVVVSRRPTAVIRGCTCGHPGAGCYCPSSNFIESTGPNSSTPEEG